MLEGVDRWLLGLSVQWADYAQSLTYPEWALFLVSILEIVCLILGCIVPRFFEMRLLPEPRLVRGADTIVPVLSQIFTSIAHETTFVTFNLLYCALEYIPYFRRFKIQPDKYPPPQLVRVRVLSPVSASARRNLSCYVGVALSPQSSLFHIYLNRVVLQVPETVGMFFLWRACGGSM
jgi:hypothetical protein